MKESRWMVSGSHLSLCVCDRAKPIRRKYRYFTKLWLSRIRIWLSLVYNGLSNVKVDAVITTTFTISLAICSTLRIVENRNDDNPESVEE